MIYCNLLDVNLVTIPRHAVPCHADRHNLHHSVKDVERRYAFLVKSISDYSRSFGRFVVRSVGRCRSVGRSVGHSVTLKCVVMCCQVEVLSEK